MVVLLLLIVTLVVEVSIVVCFVVRYVHSSFAIILMGKRGLVALLGLSYWRLIIVMWLCLTVPWVCLRFVIVIFHDHTHKFGLLRDKRVHPQVDQLMVLLAPSTSSFRLSK